MEIVRRGYVPKDSVEFGAKAAEKLNAAAQELVFLMDRGYDTKSTSTFVGNHHLLSERQRMALARIVSTASAVQRRKRKELIQAPDYLVLDGFNTIITLEVALSGSLLLDKANGRGVEVQAELHPSVDGQLSRMENVVTADAIILDKCGSWYNLTRALIQSAIPDAWILHLDGLQKEGTSCQS